eukprot:c2661_g1_i1.p1 GENE.c2661_g1_i1~~c2661_g1_i1.p1  ORF type:complete len:244 (-),score=63.65 c2661_g1_i1:55-786(-)
MSQADPFPIAKEEVQSSVNDVKAYYLRWTQLSKQRSAKEEEEYIWTRNELLQAIQNIEWDLADMTKAVNAIGQNKNLKIEPDEIAARRKFISDVRAEVTKYKSEVEKAPTTTPRQERERLIQETATGKNTFAAIAAEKMNQDFIDDNMKQQDQLVREQDKDLEVLGDTVVRLGHLGLAINDELDRQKQMLDEMDEEVDRTQGRLSTAMSKVKVMLESSDKGKLCIMFILTLVFIGLLAAVIYL